MFRASRSRSILARAAIGALYRANEGDKGAAGEEKKPDRIELTEDELTERITAAVTAAREEDKTKRKQAEKEKRDRERRERGEDEEEEDPKEVIAKAEKRAADAEQEAAQAKRDATIAKIENKLRDYLVGNYKEFLGNATDIMLHIEKALTPDATEQAISRLIEAHTKSFVERVKQAKGSHGAPAGGIRRLPLGTPPQPATEERQQKAESARKFQTLNWHG
jgi:hypothetical protein